MRDILQVAQPAVGKTAAPRSHLQIAEELISVRAPTSFDADQYRALRLRIESAHAEAGVKTIAFTSAESGEGKTITTLNLACSLGQSRSVRVLVIEADLRRPAIAGYLRLSRTGVPGLADALADEHYGLEQLVRRLEALKISVLPAGNGEADSYERLASGRFTRLLAEAREAYDYVLIDTPPLVPLADARLLGRLVDGFVLVVAAHKTPRSLVTQAVELIGPGRVVAVAFNGDDRPIRSCYRYDGHGRGAAASRTF